VMAGTSVPLDYVTNLSLTSEDAQEVCPSLWLLNVSLKPVRQLSPSGWSGLNKFRLVSCAQMLAYSQALLKKPLRCRSEVGQRLLQLEHLHAHSMLHTASAWRKMPTSIRQCKHLRQKSLNDLLQLNLIL